MSVLYQNNITTFDDSFQPTGGSKFDPWPHFEMKKLRHELTLTVEGPDDLRQAVEGCLQQATAAGLLAAVVASFTGVGIGGTAAAFTVFQAEFTRCAGEQVTAKLDDKSHWITWWT